MPAPSKINKSRSSPVTRRIAQYVNATWAGNMSAAAEALGCSFDIVWSQATGRARPSLDLLKRLCEHSGRSLDWWVYGENGGSHADQA